MKNIEDWTTKEVVLYGMAISIAAVLVGTIIGLVVISFFASALLSW